MTVGGNLVKHPGDFIIPIADIKMIKIGTASYPKKEADTCVWI